MPRANRYILPRHFYHITHRCHDRSFLLRFAIDRNSYRNWLRKGSFRYQVSILGYCITCNHIHLLAYSQKEAAISRMMQYVAGKSAQTYNRRKSRKGAFWEDRYHCTLIGSGRYLWTCSAYIDLNMVRAGVVSHPERWEWCGYRELMGTRKRYRVIDDKIWMETLGFGNIAELRIRYKSVLDLFLNQKNQLRDPQWTESIAVGDHQFVELLRSKFSRVRIDISATDSLEGKNWSIREEDTPYG